jgi:hypothetical protein
MLASTLSFVQLEIGRHGRPKLLSVGHLSLSPGPLLHHRDATKLFSSDPEKTVTEPRIEPAAAVSTNNKPAEPEAAAFPLDVPSPILLASSMVLAIAGIGKFDACANIRRPISTAADTIMEPRAIKTEF